MERINTDYIHEDDAEKQEVKDIFLKLVPTMKKDETLENVMEKAKEINSFLKNNETYLTED